MNPIGFFSHNVRTAQDLPGNTDQPAAAAGSLAGAPAKKGSFEAFLSTFGRPAEEGAASADNPQGQATDGQNPRSTAAGGAVASADSAHDGSQGTKAADLAASLAAAAGQESAAQADAAATANVVTAANAGARAVAASREPRTVGRSFGTLPQNTGAAATSARFAVPADTPASPARPSTSAASPASRTTLQGAAAFAASEAAVVAQAATASTAQTGRASTQIGQTANKTTNGRTGGAPQVAAAARANGLPAAAAMQTNVAASTGKAKSTRGDAPVSGVHQARAATDEAQEDAASDASTPLNAAAQSAAILAASAVPVANATAATLSASPKAAAPAATHRSLQATPAALAADSTQALAESDTAASIGAEPSTGSFEMVVTALSSATHFAPVARLSPTQQITDTVAAAAGSLLGTSAGSALPSAAADAAAPTSAAGAAFATMAQPAANSIKTLNLQLQPETLGQVTIKLSLSDAGLAVQVEAAHQHTAELINSDKQNLARGLSGSGYSVASLDVSVAPQHGSQFSGDASSQQGANPNADQSGGQASGFGGAPNGDRSAQNPSASVDSSLGSQAFAVGEDDAGRIRNDRGGLFV